MQLFLLLFTVLNILQSQTDRTEEFLSTMMRATSAEEKNVLIGKYQDVASSDIKTVFLQHVTELKNKSDYKNAMKICDLLVLISEARDYKEGVASGIHAIGTIQQFEDKKDEALQSFTRSQQLSELIGYDKGIADSLESIGSIKKDRGEFESALQDLNRSLEIYRGINDKKGIANSLSTIGDVYEEQSNHEKALEYYEQSLKLREEIGDPIDIGKSYVRMGNAIGPMGKGFIALKHYQDAAQLFEKAGSKSRLAGVYNNMANVVADIGNWGLGLEYYLKSLKWCEEVGSKQCMAFPMINIGVLHEYFGNYELAMSYYKKAYQLCKDAGMDTIAVVASSNIAGSYALLGRYSESLRQYQQLVDSAIKKDHDPGGLWGAMAAVYEMKGDYSKALEFCEKSLERYRILNDQIKIRELTLIMSRLQRRMKHYEEALNSAKQVINIAGDIPEILWAARLEEGRIYRDLGQREAAQKDFEEAIRLVEFLRTQITTTEWESQQYFKSRTEPYYEMIQSLASENKAEEALNYAELSKSRVLLDVLRSGRINVTKNMTAEEKEQEQRLRSDLIALNSQLLNAKNEPDQKRINELDNNLQKARLNLESFRSNLYAAHPVLSIQRGELQPARIDEAAKVLANKSALLEFVVAENKTILFVITNETEVRMHTIKLNQKHLAGLIQKFRNQLAEQDPGFRGLSMELYRLLLKPAEEDLLGKESIIIVPDRDLWDLPFQALLNSRNQFLIQKWAVSYAPSLTVLHEMVTSDQDRNSSSTLLAFANPQIATETTDRIKTLQSGENLSPLLESERGMKLLIDLYGSENSRIFTGSEAREDTFKKEAKKYDVIQVAAHGILSDTSPMYSHLIMAKGNEMEDGLLEPWEVLDLNLDASLIVLSACETARGKVSTGEGMIGFSWAFFVAGTPSTLVSQWKVDAVSTTQLMNEFHLNWRQSGVSKAEALRKAALKLLATNTYSHPFSWAGFVLIGDPR